MAGRLATVGPELGTWLGSGWGMRVGSDGGLGGEADDFCDLVHVAFEREDDLRRAESAEGPMGRNICCHRFGANSDVGPVVGAGGMDGSAGEDYGGEGGVGSAVDGEVDLSGEE